MKKLLAFLIPVCIISFIGFGVTRAVFGRQYSQTSPVEYGDRNIFSSLAITDTHWEVVNEFPYINLHCAGATTIVKQNDGDRILIDAVVPSGREVYVGASYNNDELTLEVRPKNITFSDIIEEFGKVLWSDDVFEFPDDVVVTISFPKTIYDLLNIKLGSGTLYVDELYAKFDSIEVGSGTLEMRRNENFTSDQLTLDIGSGNVKLDGFNTGNFDIDIGSGKFAVSGLSGTGLVDMGSGKGSLAFAENLMSVGIEIGSGTLDLYFENSGAAVSSSIGSGSVNINAYDVNAKLTQSDNDREDAVMFGNGLAIVNIEMGSGKVNILEAANAADIGVSIPESPVSSEASTDLTDTTTEIPNDISDLEPVTEVVVDSVTASDIEAIEVV